MCTKTVTVKNASGLHARPASLFAKEAMKFPCSVSFVCRGKTYNAKSILQVLSAVVTANTEIELVCDGENEEVALAAMVAVIEGGFGE